MPRRRVSKRVEIQPGRAAVAPKVADLRGFTVRNECGGPLTVSFSFDTETHVMTAVIEERRPSRRLPGQMAASGDGQNLAELPA